MTHEIDWLTASELAGICGTDAFALREMLETAGLADGPVAFRYPAERGIQQVLLNS